jgi:hypothetical protein
MNWLQKQLLPQDNLALCFSDPAGSNACLAIAKMFEREGLEVPLLFSNREYKGAIEHNHKIHISDTVPEDWNLLGVKTLITGTSHPESSNRFEVRCIASAIQQGLFVRSFIDHWSNFAIRFEGLSSTEYPHQILVVDEEAKKIAIAEGLPSERIIVSGNPYHYYLKNYWKPFYRGKDYLQILGIDVNGTHILFAPDPISLRIGKKKAGFTEDEALKNLLDIVSDSKRAVTILLKLHPLQPLAIINNITDNYRNDNMIVIGGANVPELLNAVDVVIGFYSNILLEAIAIGKKVIRYFPGPKSMDLLRHADIDAEFTGSYMELKKAINGVI